MIGIFFGILCIVLCVAVWRGRFRWGCAGHRYGRRFARGGRFMHGGYFGLYRLFERLDTSPGQEKAIRSALDELRQGLAGVAPHLKETRQSLAAAFASDAFDADAAQRALDAPLQRIAEGRGAFVSAVAKIHEALDVEQRRRLVRFVEA